jgi:hypothetical protein
MFWAGSTSRNTVRHAGLKGHCLRDRLPTRGTAPEDRSASWPSIPILRAAGNMVNRCSLWLNPITFNPGSSGTAGNRYQLVSAGAHHEGVSYSPHAAPFPRFPRRAAASRPCPGACPFPARPGWSVPASLEAAMSANQRVGGTEPTPSVERRLFHRRGHYVAIVDVRMKQLGDQAMIIHGVSMSCVSVRRKRAASAPSMTRWSTDMVYLSR